jgi:hypothetical protein
MMGEPRFAWMMLEGYRRLVKKLRFQARADIQKSRYRKL